MKNRIYPRIGAAVLAGLVAVVPLAGAVAAAPLATAASQSPVFLDEHGNEVAPPAADGPVSPYIQPLADDVITIDDAAAATAGSQDLPTDITVAGDGAAAGHAPSGDIDPAIEPVSADIETAQIGAAPNQTPVLIAGAALSSILGAAAAGYLLLRRRRLAQH